MKEVFLSDIRGDYSINENGDIFIHYKNAKRKAKTFLNEKGYECIAIISNDVRKIYKVHRLVALNFLPLIEGKVAINHINGIKHDNRVENLEWCTNKENSRHSLNNNLRKCKLSFDIADEIRKEYGKGTMSAEKIGRIYGVSKPAVFNVIKFKSWVRDEK